MKSRINSMIILTLLVFSSLVVVVVPFNIAQISAEGNISNQLPGAPIISDATNYQNAAHPATDVEFYINGLPNVGTVQVSLPPGEHSYFEVTAVLLTSVEMSTQINVSFSFFPFPLSASLPNWLVLPSTLPSIYLSASSNANSSAKIPIEVSNSTTNGEGLCLL